MMDRRSPVFVAFLQVIGVVLYVFILTLTVNYASGILDGPAFDQPMVGMTFFLLTFVTSALICGSLVLGYPLYLFLSSQRQEAIKIIAWSIFWFVAMLFLIAIGTLFVVQ